ncbi:MAG TPA: hypothetical protein VKT70_12320 [Stellaceae bacterium]|nr:hypothetical protein [Stellaceae bacterium]
MLSACGGRSAAPPAPVVGVSADVSPGAFAGTIDVRFVPGGPQDVITVRVVGDRPLRHAVLHAPNDTVVGAYSLLADPGPVVRQGPGGAVAPAPGLVQSTVQVNSIVSNALLRLPDPVYYDHSWLNWRLELEIGDPGSGAQKIIVPAPKPAALRSP